VLVLLDSGPLGLLVHPRRGNAIETWLTSHDRSGNSVLLPAITYYELRRELLRANLTASLEHLESLTSRLTIARVTTDVLRRASELWALSRQQGLPTAPDAALDVDVILAATALELVDAGHEVVVATSNVSHLSRFVNAREWMAIQPGD
jgi:predicted nucleic acid-binding protein